MEIVENSAIKFSVDSDLAATLDERIEKLEVLKDDGVKAEVLMFWGLKETQQLARYYDASNIPSPMANEYKWPGMYKPFDHQVTTASFLSIRDRAFCFNEAGTGKTSSVIWAADYLMKMKQIQRVLIICPLSIMYSAWQADVFKTAIHRTVGVAHGSASKRKKIIDGDYDFVVINFDGVGTVREDIAKANFDLIVVDEANAYKTATTKRWKTLQKLVTPSTKLWMLTGTPASQSPLDAYGLAKMAVPHKVPKTFGAWRDRVMQQITQFKWIPKKNASGDVFKALQPAIRFTKAECLDLPEVVYQTREVPLTPQVKRYYKILKDRMMVEAAGEQISAVNAAASLSKLLQIAGGAVYTDTHEVIEFDINPRLSALQEVIDETDNKVIIFVPYRHTIDVVSDSLKAKGLSTEIISGDVTAKQRSDIINRFQTSDDPKILIIQPQSASHGVTLTAADTVVFWSPVMSVETYIQCVARIDRVGQKNSMTVVHLQGADVERKMYDMLQGKINMHEKLVDLYKQEIGA